MLSENKISKIIGTIYFLNLFFYLLFGRPYSGIYLFGFRVGEIILGFFLVLNIIILFLPSRYLNVEAVYDTSLIYIYKLMTISFFVVLFINNGSVANLYSYKSSSYIWMLGVIFFTSYFVKSIFHKKIFYIFLCFYLVYQFSTIHYPVSIISFFETYADKFDFQKGSDLLIIYVVSILFIQRNTKNKFNALTIFIISSSILLPLFLYKSKGAFLPAVIFIIYYSIVMRKEFFKNKLKTSGILLISVILFFVSTFEVYGNLNFKKMGMDGYNSAEELTQLFTADEIGKGLTAITSEKNTDEFFSIIFYYGWKALFKRDDGKLEAYDLARHFERS